MDQIWFQPFRLEKVPFFPTWFRIPKDHLYVIYKKKYWRKLAFHFQFFLMAEEFFNIPLEYCPRGHQLQLLVSLNYGNACFDLKKKLYINYTSGAQSFTSLMADICQGLDRVSY